MKKSRTRIGFSCLYFSIAFLLATGLSTEPARADSNGILSEIYQAARNQAKKFSDETLISQLNSPSWQWAYVTPQHIIDEVMERASDSGHFSAFLKLIPEEIKKNSIRSKAMADTISKLLTTADLIPVSMVDDSSLAALKISPFQPHEVELFYFNLLKRNGDRLQFNVLVKLANYQFFTSTYSGETIAHYLLPFEFQVLLGNKMVNHPDASAKDLISVAKIIDEHYRRPYAVWWRTEELDLPKVDDDGRGLLGKIMLKGLALDRKAAVSFCEEAYLRFLGEAEQRFDDGVGTQIDLLQFYAGFLMYRLEQQEVVTFDKEFEERVDSMKAVMSSAGPRYWYIESYEKEMRRRAGLPARSSR